MNDEDLAYEALKQARPALEARDYASACAVIREYIALAMDKNQTETAASLYSTLGGYLTILSDLETALEAYESAEMLMPTHQSYAVIKLRHLYLRLKRYSGVRESAERIARSGDPLARHKATVFLGLMDLDKGDTASAAARLSDAIAIAEAHDVPAMLWDLSLSNRLSSAHPDAASNFFSHLLRQAHNEGDASTVAKAEELIADMQRRHEGA